MSKLSKSAGAPATATSGAEATEGAGLEASRGAGAHSAFGFSPRGAGVEAASISTELDDILLALRQVMAVAEGEGYRLEELRGDVIESEEMMALFALIEVTSRKALRACEELRDTLDESAKVGVQ